MKSLKKEIKVDLVKLIYSSISFKYSYNICKLAKDKISLHDDVTFNVWLQLWREF